MRTRRFVAAASALALTAGLTQLLPSAHAAATVNSPNLTLLANLKQKLGKADGTPLGNATGADAFGSDIEFLTDVDVTGLPGAGTTTGLRDFALAGSLSAGLQIVDITTPATPVTAAVYDCKLAQGDIQVFKKDGKTYATYTADYDMKASKCYTDAKTLKYISSGTPEGTFIVDLTNPYRPTTVSFIPVPLGSHNMTVHPSGNFLYNSNNELTNGIGVIEPFDITDVTKPKALPVLNLVTGVDSHDVTFSADGKRAYSAAINHSLIINTENPAAPTIIGRVLDPSITIHHQAEPIDVVLPQVGARRLLVVTDEVGGGSYGSACPGGAIHVFDVTGPLEQAPVKLGVYEAPVIKPAGGGTDATGSALGCTSHVLRFHPKEKIMTIAWYNLGVHVVDITSMLGPSVGVTAPVAGGPSTGSLGAGMKELGYSWSSDTDTWSAKTPRIAADGSFYLFANDIARGLDVYKFVRPAAGTTAPLDLTWKAFTPEQFRAKVTKARLGSATGLAAPRCTLRSLAARGIAA